MEKSTGILLLSEVSQLPSTTVMTNHIGCAGHPQLVHHDQLESASGSGFCRVPQCPWSGLVHAVGRRRTCASRYCTSMMAYSCIDLRRIDGAVIPLGALKRQNMDGNRAAHVHLGTGLDYNEYVIFNPAQTRMRFLVAINFCFDV
ncbi:hypothetical protein H257_13665 [Aphanomyces astaci]|uniref:Uncharacterized protein n=1 Tax=Aphanomyces astaci TaxID=112090 RepID=W4FTS6_APHAT|nr:hypothetical protein H257_13665 [Aphanomyces astaci]ETV70910.1 hypothetical protein H257_13665 [Aphanomyces astaci]|eukprot:XP_009839573.1 hypothetical protein H257_13665 [Aphanomyces astaci]